MIATWMFGLATVVLTLALYVQLRSVKPPVNRAQLTFSEAGFRDVVRRWSPEQLARVQRHFALDYAYLVAYGGLGLSLAMALQQRGALPSAFAADVWPWLLPLAAVCDALENLLHQRFLREAPGSSPASLFVLSGCAASAKWLLLAAYLVLLAVWFLARGSAS